VFFNRLIIEFIGELWRTVDLQAESQKRIRAIKTAGATAIVGPG
jgi:hypothetical protein